MADNMTIGPALVIGGNKIEMTQKGKVKITNPQGKVKTLSQDEFKKQLVQNKDKIKAEQDFEFKKDNKNAKAAAGVAGLLGAAYIGLGIAVGKGKLTKSVAEAGKELGFMSKVKNVFVSIGESGVDLWKVLTGKAAKLKDKVTGNKAKSDNAQTIYNGETTANATSNDLNARLTSKETLNLKNETSAKMADAHIKYVEKIKNQSYSDLAAREKELNSVFADFDPVKDPIKLKKESKMREEESKILEKFYLTRKQYAVVKEYANSADNVKLTKEQKEILPKWIQDQESCRRYTNAIEAKFAKIDKECPEIDEEFAKLYATYKL